MKVHDVTFGYSISGLPHQPFIMFENGESLLIPVKELDECVKFDILKLNERIIFVTGEHRHFRARRICKFYNIFENRWLSESETDIGEFSLFPTLPHVDFIVIFPQPIHVCISYDSKSLSFYCDQSYEGSGGPSHKILESEPDFRIGSYLAKTVFSAALRDPEDRIRWCHWYPHGRSISGLRRLDLRIPNDEVLQIRTIDVNGCGGVGDAYAWDFISLKYLQSLSVTFQISWRAEFDRASLRNGWEARIQAAYHSAIEGLD